jgi:dipeptidyl aminopeptidase/acylaminoacyl peptidase
MSRSDERTDRRLDRDGQQWVFDWMIQETGKVMHFQGEGRGGLPRAVRRHAMISKHVGRSAQRMERLADEAHGEGHGVTALGRYFEAAFSYGNAQHVVFETNDEKRFLHDASLRCYEHVRGLAPYRIERIEIPFEGSQVAGYLHLHPGDTPRPLVFFVPGCDMTKEQYPHPQFNHALQRGLHLFSFDGPGQGEGNMRGLHLTADNYERAASAAIDHLLERPEIDADRLCVYAISFGSLWGARIAANDKRVFALAAPWATFGELRHLMDEESPRFKQLFMYLTGSRSEDEVDAVMDAMGIRHVASQIECPTLVAVGEYDPRSPIEEVYDCFDLIPGPSELWVFEDQHHRLSLTKPNAHITPWQMDIHEIALDWLGDRLAGKPMPGEHRVVSIPTGQGGPASLGESTRRWFA